MAQSGKDAILAAARRIAQLDSDDDDDLDTDADWANWGGIDWKNLDVDHDAAELARDAVAESEAKTAEALGIPVRLARWLAKHKGGDVRRAFHVATRNRGSNGAGPTPDADGTVPLGNKRPKYVPLEERVVAVKPAAMPTKRPEDFEALRRLKEARENAEARRREVAAGSARAIAEEQKKENVALTPAAKAAVAQALISREQRPDMAPGAGPAGRHEPSKRSARVPVDVTLAVGANVAAVMGVMGVAGASADTKGEGEGDAKGTPAKRLTGAERAAADNALLKLLPSGERPLISQMAGTNSKIPKPTRQQTLDGFAAAALRAEARGRFDGGDPDSTWIRTHLKARRRAMTRAIEAESRVNERSGSKVTYRNLSAQALRTEETTRVGPDPDEGVTLRNDAIDPADRDAVSFANDVASRAKTCRGATPVGLTEPEPGALLQGYKRPAADGIVLADARVVRGDAAVAFFTAAASIARPVLRLCERARRMLERRNASKRKANEVNVAAEGPIDPKRAKPRADSEPKKNEKEERIPGRPEVIAAVRSFVDAYMAPLVDVGAVHSTVARTIAGKATAKVMSKHERARDAAPILAKESDAIKKLVKAYVQREQKARWTR
jgi:hypothetical protein